MTCFPGRRGAGRIFHNQVALSGKVPQICCLFGPSAAGGAYIPSFCDVVIMVEANASMYLGSPRMAEMVVGEKVTLEEMGGARMHATISGCGDQLAADDADAIEQAKQYFSYLPLNWRSPLPTYDPLDPARDFTDDLVPAQESAGYDIRTVIEAIVDEGSFLEVKPLFAPELVTGFALLEGEVIGIVANQPAVKGGVLFVDSADKGARFIWQCDAFSIPLLYLADVPGFMIGSAVERQGIIRHGAKMITAVAEATVPTVSLIIRKAYGAGLYAMGGPGFGPDACLALPTAKIAVMGPEAAINAVYANKIAEINDEAERTAYVERLRKEYEIDIDILRLASELVVDGIVEPRDVRRELIARFAAAATKDRHFSSRRHGVPPVYERRARSNGRERRESRADRTARGGHRAPRAERAMQRRSFLCERRRRRRIPSAMRERPRIKGAACGTVGAVRAAGPTSRRAVVRAPRRGPVCL